FCPECAIYHYKCKVTSRLHIRLSDDGFSDLNFIGNHFNRDHMAVTAAPTRLKADIGFASHIGRHDDNQDFAAACLADVRSHHGLVAAVADAVGGRKGGRVAAELSVRAFIDDFLSQTEALSPQKTAGRA